MVEAAIGVQPELRRGNVGEQQPNAIRDQRRAFRVEGLDVDHAGAQLAIHGELTPEARLGHFAAGEFEHELVAARLQNAREQSLITARGTRPALEIAEAEVEEQLDAALA